MCDGRVDVFDSGGGVINTVTIDTDRHAKVSAGMQGSPFQRALPAGELSADSRGSAPPGASDRSGGEMLPASPSESATASFDGRRLSKVLLRYFRRK